MSGGGGARNEKFGKTRTVIIPSRPQAAVDERQRPRPVLDSNFGTPPCSGFTPPSILPM